jgi:Tol biopolymer transport system component
MELLEGETLEQRLRKGPLPLEYTLRLGMEIADALDKAHRQGIVHRDLKPANVMVTTSGVKLLDFGPAKAATPLFATASATVVDTVAMPQQLTEQGTFAGTLQYMAPEQLEGRPAEPGSDIFALGAMLYEMATGKKAFTGSSPVALASAILHDEPPPLALSDHTLPFALGLLVRTCLAKDQEQRWQSAHDVGLQLRAIADKADTEIPSTGASATAVWTRWAPWGVTAATLVALAATASLRPAREASSIPVSVRFSVPPPSGGAFYESYENTGLAVSPDGSRLAFSAREASGARRVWLRPVSALEATAVASTDGATSLFWSPDGRSLAFFAGGKLRRIDLPGGTPVSICDVLGGIGFSGTWGADGQILFSSIEGESIFSVAASGGVPAAIMKVDRERGEARLTWPLFLPDGRRFFYLQRRRDGSGHLMIAETGQAPRDVMPLQSSAQYVDPGYLVFASEGALVGQRFDLSRGQVSGAPFSIADPVGYSFTTTVARFATSVSGTLVYQSHTDEARLLWFDRSGREVGSIGERGEYQGPRISPDEQRVVFSRARAGALDVWEADLVRHVETRLTFGASSEGTGPWMPDGRTLFFGADVGAPPTIFRKNLTTGADESVLPASGTFQAPEDVSPDGKTLLYTQRGAGGGDIRMFALDGSRAQAGVVESPFDEENIRFSRDGRFISFDSNASGGREVYVAPYPPTGATTRVSTTGGAVARWSREGGELFFLSPDGRLMTVPIQTSPSLRIGTPVPLFEWSAKRPWFEFDVASAGRFLAVVSGTRANEQPLTVVLNWTAGIRH